MSIKGEQDFRNVLEDVINNPTNYDEQLESLTRLRTKLLTAPTIKYSCDELTYIIENSPLTEHEVDNLVAIISTKNLSDLAYELNLLCDTIYARVANQK